ncbi:MAG TPA: hypothetical protein VFE31_14550 [Opitutaceae bacterium]|jgi:hypothetical protein|nr:hypothetical protein [Opitutaceae bacterium]
MKHILSVVVLGAGAALATHWGWYRLHAAPAAIELTDQLAWMKAELRLNDEQYARIASLYRANSPRLQALSAQVARMREAYQAFESARVRTDRVDFLAFADFMRHQRELDRECAATLQELVDATSGVMTPAQRERYVRVVRPALKAEKLAAD